MNEYIEREAALEAVCKYCCEYDAESTECICNERLTFLKIPTSDVAPVRHGRWVTQDETRTKFMCSLCESKNYGGHEKFCPNCGAKMDGES